MTTKTYYRYRCTGCGKTGRWLQNGNAVIEAGDNHCYGSQVVERPRTCKMRGDYELEWETR